ncbi:MAG: hypothetical protein ACRDYB_04375 [Acidimicrobiales bacterium]
MLTGVLAGDLYLDLDLVLTDLNSVLADLNDALHDFTAADLRDVDLTHVHMDRLRWSSATQWPTDWVAQVELDSVEVAPDVFEVRRGQRVGTNAGVVAPVGYGKLNHSSAD